MISMVFFPKKCWHIIKGSFYNLCDEFYSGMANLECIKTLCRSPDFRLIFLLNSSLKVLAKILADRLQEVILNLIHKNQYDFIRSRSI